MNPEITELFHELANLTASERDLYYDGHSVSPESRAIVESLLKFDIAPDHSLTESIACSVEHSLESLDTLEPFERLGPYRLERLLGRGGMGSVYLAKRVDGEVKQQVAVKLLPYSGRGPSFRERFLRERQILANLNHPGIARLMDAGHANEDRPYLVLEYVDGMPIDEFLKDAELEKTLRTFLKICDAVFYAHRNLIVHRDLKPSNILVDRTGEPKLLDFGIAKILDEARDQTQTRDRLLTPDYASPEQVCGGIQTTATDVYSLGAVLYKLLTGKSPHAPHGTDGQDVIDVVRLNDPPRPSSLNSNLPRDLDFIVGKALRKEPNERYGSVDAFADDIKSYLESRPVRARSGSAWYRGRKFVRRYWVPITAAAAVFASLAVGLAIAARERDLADRRFRDVRRIAGELLNVERDISTLPGGTPARERIVSTSLRYLEDLAAGAGNDLPLKREIAAGYRRVAEVQGGFRSANLGRPQEARASLEKAESLLRQIRKARPADLQALRDLIETVDLESRIDHGAMNLVRLEERVSELQTLVEAYQTHVPDRESEWSFLAAMYNSIATSAGFMSHTDQQAAFSKRAVDYQRRAAQELKTLPARGNLERALETYGSASRRAGNLEDAARAYSECVSILEGILAEQANNFQARRSLANTLIGLGRVYGDAGGPSLGQLDKALENWERGLKIGREVIASDPKEVQGRFNQAVGDYLLGNAVRDHYPARALAAYDEAIDALRPTGGSNLSRQVLAMQLAESTFPLRKLHRETEARRRLQEAKQISAAFRGQGANTLECDQSISAAEADWAMVSGHPLEAAERQREFLAEARAEGADNVNQMQNLNDAFTIARRYRSLAQALTAAGRSTEAAQAEAQRSEIVEYWQKKRPGDKLVESLFAR